MRKVLLPVGFVFALSGCSHMIDAMERSVEANSEAIRICSENNMSLSAEQTLYRRNTSNVISTTLKFPTAFKPNDNSIPAMVSRLEDKIKALAKAAYKDGTDRSEDVQKTLKNLRSSYEVTVDKLENIRKLIRRISDTIDEQFNNTQNGSLLISAYAPGILTAVQNIRSDVSAIDVELARLTASISDLVAAAEAAGTHFATIKTELETTGTDSIQELINQIRTELTFARNLHAAIMKESGSIDLVFASVKDEIERRLKSIVRYKAAKLAVKRLEKEIFIIEGKLNQVDEKVWFAISLAQLLFTNDIREALAGAISDRIKTDRDSIADVDNTETSERLRHDVSALGDNDSYGLTAPDKEDVSKTASEKLKAYADFWLRPLATASCERVMEVNNQNNLSKARADQLLSPIYLAIIQAYEDGINPITGEQRAETALQQIERARSRVNSATMEIYTLQFDAALEPWKDAEEIGAEVSERSAKAATATIRATTALLDALSARNELIAVRDTEIAALNALESKVRENRSQITELAEITTKHVLTMLEDQSVSEEAQKKLIEKVQTARAKSLALQAAIVELDAQKAIVDKVNAALSTARQAISEIEGQVKVATVGQPVTKKANVFFDIEANRTPASDDINILAGDLQVPVGDLEPIAKTLSRAEVDPGFLSEPIKAYAEVSAPPSLGGPAEKNREESELEEFRKLDEELIAPISFNRDMIDRLLNN